MAITYLWDQAVYDLNVFQWVMATLASPDSDSAGYKVHLSMHDTLIIYFFFVEMLLMFCCTKMNYQLIIALVHG